MLMSLSQQQKRQKEQTLTYNSGLTGKTTVGVFGFNTGMTLKEYYVEKR